MRFKSDETYPSPWILPLMAMVLGALFLVTGVAKLAEFSPFVQTVGALAGLHALEAGVAGAAVVLAEIAAGTALICRYRVAIAALLLSCMTAFFIAILLISIVSEIPVTCHCFGLLGSLPSHTELLLDVVLFDLLLLLALFYRQRSWPAYGRTGILCLTLILAGAEITTVHAAFAHAEKETDVTMTLPLASADTLVPAFRESRTGTRALFMLRFADFSCALCFDDFMFLSDSLATLPPMLQRRIAALMCTDSTALFRSPDRLQQWVRQSGIAFPVVAVADTLFRAAGIQKSMVAVVDADGRLLLTGEFPLGAERRARLVHLLTPAFPE